MASLLRSTSHLHVTRNAFNPQSTPNSNTRVSIGVSNRQSFTSQAQARRSEPPLRICECHDQYNVQVPYINAWQWQKEIVAEKVAMLGKAEDFDDTLIILQHPPVYTLGTRSTEANLKFDVNDPSFELHRTERGGEVTFHGPGQLVMYPILNLRWHKMDLHWYLRTLEEVVIGAVEKACGIRAHRIEGLTGVWVDNQKVAAVGVRVTRWIAYHGVALNVTTDLAPFSNIIPCGISDYSVTSVAKALPIFLADMFNEFAAVLMSVTLVFAFGEEIPQAVCPRHGLAIGANSIRLVEILMILCWPIAYPFGKMLDHSLGHKRLWSVQADAAQGTCWRSRKSDDETTIIQGALDLTEKTALDSMTPLEATFSLDVSSTLNWHISSHSSFKNNLILSTCVAFAQPIHHFRFPPADLEAIDKIMARGHSRIPVYDGDKRNIVGVLLCSRLDQGFCRNHVIHS